MTSSSTLPLKKRPVRSSVDFGNIHDLVGNVKRQKVHHHNMVERPYINPLQLFHHQNGFFRQDIPSTDVLTRHLEPLIHATALDYSLMTAARNLEAFRHLSQQNQSMSSASSSISSSSPYSFLPPSPSESCEYPLLKSIHDLTIISWFR